MLGATSLALMGGLTLAAAPAPSPPAAVTKQLDAAMQEHWKAAGVAPVGPADDAAFLRRVWLDLAGVTPPPEEVQAFLADKDPNKRAKQIDKLLDSDEFADHWAAIWAQQLLGGRRPIKQDKYDGRVLRAYLRDAIKGDVSYKTVATDLITGEGASDASGPADFLLRYEGRPTDLVGAVFKNFQGVSLQCAQCHDHPFTHWKKDDFWGVAAFFGRVRLVESGDGDDYITAILETRRGDLKVPDPTAKPNDDGSPAMKVVKPRLPGAAAGATPHPTPPPQRGEGREGGRRAALAAWITADDNPYFATHAVNDAWARLFGAGLMPPVDGVDRGGAHDLTATVDLLAADFKTSNYDLKRLVRVIVMSRAYQLGSGDATLATGDAAAEMADLQARNFARFRVRPLSVDQLYASVVRATGYKGDDPPPPDPATPNPPADSAADPAATPPEPPATDDDPPMDDPSDRPVDVLGERAQTVQRALAMLYGDYIHKAVQAGAQAQLKGADRAPTAADVERLFLATLSRRPTKDEAKAMQELLRGGDGAAGLEDVMWAILNSAEFNTNH